MAWVKLDDQFFGNPKVIELSPGAKLLYIGGLTYCGAQLTDGMIGRAAVRMVAAMVDVDRAVVAELVARGLWIETEEGYVIHDYLEYNPSAEKVRADREAAKERMHRVRSPEVRPNIQANVARSSPSPSKSRPDPDPVTDPLPQGDVGDVRSVGGGATSAPKRRGKRAETPAPDSFPITDDLAAWAENTVPEIDLERETERFLHSARAKGRTYANWESAWKGWMTNDFPKALKSGALGRPTPTGGPPRASPDLAAQQPPRTQQNIEALRRVGHAIRGLPGATAPAGGGDEQGAQRPADHAVVEEIPPPR